MSAKTITNYSFDRNFLEERGGFHFIGSGEIGGKAGGLAFIKKILAEKLDPEKFSSFHINVPNLAVIRTDVFDAFMERNNLYDIAYSDSPDERIARTFLKANLPLETLGDLRTIIEKIKTPLAIRSSSRLEDRKDEPFAGIFATKMVPNNQPDRSVRFNKLTEAIKFIYASTFFKASKNYITATKYSIEEEKMSVIVQTVVGEERNRRFYPSISGVARSYNYYPAGRAKPEDSVVDLAVGLGKTIVDGGITWSYSPKYPKLSPPFADPKDMMKKTQNTFWAVDTSTNAKYDPLKESEYLTHLNLQDADSDSSIKYSASTYNAASDKVVIGIGNDGPRILNFAPLLIFDDYKFNELIKMLLQISEEAVGFPVEIEFAVNFPKDGTKPEFGFLQVRPMVVMDENVTIEDNEIHGEQTLLCSNRVMGNGIVDNLEDVIYVKPDVFDKKNTKQIALEIEILNKKMIAENKPYVLIGFGRWGSSDPWLGIPIDWGQIAGAKVIVESTLPGINVELSQGSHFFHNLTSFKVCYFSVHFGGDYKINWDWLETQQVVEESDNVKHIHTLKPLLVKVDGKNSLGVIKFDR